MGILGRLMGTAETATGRGVRSTQGKGGTQRNVGGRVSGKTLRATPTSGRMRRGRSTPTTSGGIGRMVSNLLRRR
jgi:hypothetical protein